jgi:hypothetical protein
MPSDGRIKDPDSQQKKLLSERLDFALVRLEDAVGARTRRDAGGLRRSWISLSNLNTALSRDDRIIIPQHPNGYPQRVDFGRYIESDSSATRIRYSTETAPGTSGAPCFDHHFRLVGVHNAAFMPHGDVVVANQAVLADRIVKKLGTPLPIEVPAPSTRIWSVSPDRRAPRVILGRGRLLDWIEGAAKLATGLRSERLFAVTGPVRSGKSFSWEILRAARRDQGEPIVILGGDEQLPRSAADFVRAICDQLRVPESDLKDMPARPSVAPPPGVVASVDGDKLRKWASEEIPLWLNGVLRNHREPVVDLRDESKLIVETFRKAGLEPPGEHVERMNLPDKVPESRHRWAVGWMVVDRLADTTPSSEIQDLIAGLIGGSYAESSMPSELRRLRWLFLGTVPDFVVTEGIVPEKLDAMAIGNAEIFDGAMSVASSFHRQLNDDARDTVKAAIEAMMTEPLLQEALQDPARRLTVMQGFLLRLAAICAGRQKQWGTP